MTPSEYLTSVYQLIRENFRATDPSGGMTAASAAYLTKRILGDHAEFGFPKFKDVVAALSAEGRLRFGENSKGALSIWLIDSNPAVDERTSLGFRRLRSQIWFAFISQVPEGRRYLNPQSGEVQLGCASPPEDSWVEIQPIPQEEERAAAIQFLDEHEIADPEVRKLLEEDRWFAKLPRKLLAISPQLARDWNRNRSARVIKYVTNWCETNGVHCDILFSPTMTAERVGARSAREYLPVGEASGLRRALLDAIARMSNEELLSVSIPASHLVAVLRPDLLK